MSKNNPVTKTFNNTAAENSISALSRIKKNRRSKNESVAKIVKIFAQDEALKRS
jgi:hypothetical protein